MGGQKCKIQAVLINKKLYAKYITSYTLNNSNIDKLN